MKAFLTALCILSALVTTGDAMNCEVCYAEDTTCTSSSQNCSQKHMNEECLTSTTEFYHGNNKSSLSEKSCVVFPNSCNQSFSFSTQNFSMRFQSSCCNSENCNTDTIVLPPKNTTKNGVRCPVCEIVHASDCDSKGQTMECSGMEIKCISFAGKIYEQVGSFIETAFRGCITKEACEIVIKPYPYSQYETGFKLECTPGISTTA